MSRLIKKPIMIPQGVTVKTAGDFLDVKGPKGELKVRIPIGGAADIKEGSLMANTGTLWALTRNAIQGVTEGFTKVLEIEGVGYRAVIEGKTIVLYLGYALPVRLPIPDGVTIVVEKNVVKISGISNDLVGRVAADIRSHKKPEPYKGKGIRYQGEVVRRKVGKKAATAGSA